MNRKNWEKFAKLSENCFANLIGADSNWHCWIMAFDQLKTAIQEERESNPEFAPTIFEADDATEYQYDILGWLEDCLDKVEIMGEHELLLKMCEDLITLFNDEGGLPSDIGFKKMSALAKLDRADEAAQYCRDRLERCPDDPVAAAAGVYAFTKVGETGDAEALIHRFIPEGTVCDEESCIMFTAACEFYKRTGDAASAKKYDDILEAYDKQLEKEFEDYCLEYDEDGEDDEPLTF